MHITANIIQITATCKADIALNASDVKKGNAKKQAKPRPTADLT